MFVGIWADVAGYPCEAWGTLAAAVALDTIKALQYISKDLMQRIILCKATWSLKHGKSKQEIFEPHIQYWILLYYRGAQPVDRGRPVDRQGSAGRLWSFLFALALICSRCCKLLPNLRWMDCMEQRYDSWICFINKTFLKEPIDRWMTARGESQTTVDLKQGKVCRICVPWISVLGWGFTKSCGRPRHFKSSWLGTPAVLY